MEKGNTRESPFSKLHHVTIVVNDIEQAANYYESLGIGPFVTPVKHEVNTRTLRGKPVTPTMIVRETRIGTVVLQLIQHLEGECLVKEFIDKKGEGVFHLGFVVDDLDKEEDKAVKLGLKVTERGRRVDGSGFTFFDTEAMGGVILEIRQSSSEFSF